MYTMSLALAVHVLAAVIWVGGMAFAYWFLRPAAGRALDRAARLDLWHDVFSRFFPAVWVAAIALLVSGYVVIFAGFDGFAHVGWSVHLMHGLAWVMLAIFAYVFFVPWRRLRRALDSADHDDAVEALDRIRRFVALNLTLGLIVVAAASGGRYL